MEKPFECPRERSKISGSVKEQPIYVLVELLFVLEVGRRSKKLGHLLLEHPVSNGRTSRSVGDSTFTLTRCTRAHARVFRARTGNIVEIAPVCERATHTRAAMHLSCSATVSGSQRRPLF